MCFSIRCSVLFWCMVLGSNEVLVFFSGCMLLVVSSRLFIGVSSFIWVRCLVSRWYRCFRWCVGLVVCMVRLLFLFVDFVCIVLCV